MPSDPDVDDVNAMVQANLATNFPGSVWQYYKLVNVQWALSRVSDAPTPIKAPARLAKMLPSKPVSNTTMETYLQRTTCTACHASATLAKPGNISADFSFLFATAGR